MVMRAQINAESVAVEEEVIKEIQREEDAGDEP